MAVAHGTWQFHSSNGWKSFTAEVSNLAEAAHAAGSPRVQFRLGGADYELDFGKMAQVRLDDPSRVRKVRRSTGAPSVPAAPVAAAPVCTTYGKRRFGPCKYGDSCRSAECPYDHSGGMKRRRLGPGPCKYGDRCHDPRCPYEHPGGRGCAALHMRVPDGSPVGLEKIPMHWSPMGEKKYLEVELLGNKNYAKESAAITAFFAKSAKHTIVSIKRIQNLTLWRMYQDKRELVKAKKINKGKANDHFLWHGASSSSKGTGASASIMKTGFEGLYSNCSPAGIWLSTNAAYSRSYAEASRAGNKIFFLVRTTLGYISTDDGTGHRPKKQGTEFADSHHCGGTSIGHRRKDDQVGGGSDNRYVIYSNSQLYPAYLVEFK